MAKSRNRSRDARKKAQRKRAANARNERKLMMQANEAKLLQLSEVSNPVIKEEE